MVVARVLHPDKEHGSTALFVHGMGELLAWYMLERRVGYSHSD